MINKLYSIAGYFYLGMATVGIIAYSCQTFDRLKSWGHALGAVALLTLILLAVVDDAMINYLKISRLAYLGVIIGSAVFLLVGVLIQWQ
jgi:hypothetical protein